MSRRHGLFVRIRARLHDDERGFSLVETVIAITIIFGSLITLAMSASTGFRYVGIGREEQAANQIANQLMEEARGLAFTKIAQGMQLSDLSSDPNVLNDVSDCSGTDADAYWYLSCGGDLVEWTDFDCPTRPTDCSTPLVPSSGTIGASEDYPVDYDWRTYVTRECTSATEACTSPYKVTVLVEWAGAGTAASGIQRVTTQSLFHSPIGCVSSQTHPFAAPCQPFFYGQVLAPAGRITVSGTVSGVDFSSGVITTTGADSTLQVEQVSSVQGSWTQSGTELTTSAGTSLGGATTSRSTAADSDPSGSTPAYSATTAGALGTGSNQFASGGSNFVQVQNAANDTGQAISATAAGGLDACPPTPPAPPLETDLQPCGGAFARQAGTARVVGHFHGYASDVGDATIASIGAPTLYTTTFANRVPVSGENGNVQETATRAFGTVSIGGLPEFVTAPVGWTGYFAQLTGYQDTVVSTAGTAAAAPTATINAGTLIYWNGLGYTSVNLATTPSYSLTGLLLDHTTLTADLHTVRVRIATDSVAMESVPTVTSTPSGSGSILRNETKATVGSPLLGTFTYEMWLDGSEVVNLAIDLSLGTLTSKSVYEPAPSAGA
jgi:type II secretory pathway pseudopilin PulG